MSEFELIDEKKVKNICPFCTQVCTEEHLRKAHCFPPFRDECANLEGLLELVNDKVK
jgi:hypothetical protein